MATAANLQQPRAGTERVDARDKVRGRVLYAADDARPGMLHAYLVPSRISSGSITRIDTSAAMRVAGVKLVLTHENIGPIGATTPGFPPLQPLRTPDIRYRGQTVAMVVADSFEAAREAAALVSVDYAAQPFVPSLGSPGAQSVPQSTLLPLPPFADKKVGDADAAVANAAVTIDATYDLPRQHHNPIEMIATVAEWQDGFLNVKEPSQNTEGIRHGLAKLLALDPARIRVQSPSVGGGFGQKNKLQPHTYLVAVAARTLGRQVKLVVPRTQLFHVASFRPASRQRVRLAADRSGRIDAAIHEIDQQTSRYDVYPVGGTEMSARLYGVSHFRGAERLVRTDTQTPGPMRAPSEQPASFAFESAIDELAYRLDMDPVALRLANDTQTDPLTKKPFSSRHVATCLTRGAEAFGWSKRTMAPGSMRAPDGTQIGWGVAIGAYPANTSPAIAKVRLSANGRVYVAVGGHEMGQGIRTAIAITVNRVLGAPIGMIDIDIGDTAAAPQHLTAGSWGSATALPPVAAAAAKLLANLRERAGPAMSAGPAGGPAPSAVALLLATGAEFVEAESSHQAPGQAPAAFERMKTGQLAINGAEYPDFVAYSFIAHFVEVRVEPTTRRVRVTRSVSIVDCGNVISPRTARSQVEGAMVWGIGAALREIGEVDPRYGNVVNADLAEYVLPVAADVGRIEVDFINQPDPKINAQGVKGLGEIALVGVSAAIGNAVFHATGKRVRHLPIRVEDLL